jgi:hypothetical protein
MGSGRGVRRRVRSSQETEPRSSRLSVFNGHVNNAAGRADEKFIKQYGLECFRRYIKSRRDQGIMTIFEEAYQNRYTQAWIEWVTEFVNEVTAPPPLRPLDEMDVIKF